MGSYTRHYIMDSEHQYRLFVQFAVDRNERFMGFVMGKSKEDIKNRIKDTGIFTYRNAFIYHVDKRVMEKNGKNNKFM